MEGSAFKPEERSLGFSNLQAAPGDHTHDGSTSKGPIEFTPVWRSSATQPVLNNGVSYGRYVLLGRMVHLYVQITMGSTTTFGTGAYSIDLPVAAEAGKMWFVQGAAYDASLGNWEPITAWWDGSGTTLDLQTLTTVGSVMTFVTETSPFTWAVNDRIILNGAYGY